MTFTNFQRRTSFVGIELISISLNYYRYVRVEIRCFSHHSFTIVAEIVPNKKKTLVEKISAEIVNFRTYTKSWRRIFSKEFFQTAVKMSKDNVRRFFSKIPKHRERRSKKSSTTKSLRVRA